MRRILEGAPALTAAAIGQAYKQRHGAKLELHRGKKRVSLEAFLRAAPDVVVVDGDTKTPKFALEAADPTPTPTPNPNPNPTPTPNPNPTPEGNPPLSISSLVRQKKKGKALEEEAQARTLWMGGVKAFWTEDHFREALLPYSADGSVEAIYLPDSFFGAKKGRKPRGAVQQPAGLFYAFVRLRAVELVLPAVAALAGRQVHGSTLQVRSRLALEKLHEILHVGTASAGEVIDEAPPPDSGGEGGGAPDPPAPADPGRRSNGKGGSAPDPRPNGKGGSPAGSPGSRAKGAKAAKRAAAKAGAARAKAAAPSATDAAGAEDPPPDGAGDLRPAGGGAGS